jgi:hypothetical protein
VGCAYPLAATITTQASLKKFMGLRLEQKKTGKHRDQGLRVLPGWRLVILTRFPNQLETSVD